MKEPYNQRDHSCCFTQKTPPCGQRIEHLYCCLCEKANPKVKQDVSITFRKPTLGMAWGVFKAWLKGVDLKINTDTGVVEINS